MNVFSPQALAGILEDALPSSVNGLCVAFSGGVDSTVLLHALHATREQHPQWSLRALHIDHQLQSNSSRWAEECARVASLLAIPFECKRVQVAGARSGPEAAARKARYDALRAEIGAGEVLLTAHNADDQLETVLLALMRGSGVAGLAAMPVTAAFGAGLHVRPLLSFARAELETWATGRGIAGIQDPTNAELRFDRNFLRHAVVPMLKQRWPAVAHTASRSAGHFATADALLDELAANDATHAAVGECLRVTALQALSPGRRHNVLRHWIHRRGFLLPSTRKLSALDNDMLAARADSMPCVTWQGAEVRRYDDLLYLMSSLPAAPQSAHMSWEFSQTLRLSGMPGALSGARVQGTGLALDRLPPHLSVRFRQGGEQMKPRHGRHHRTLKYLLHDARVLPWWRNRIPLIFAGDELIAVADLWIDDRWAASGNAEGVRIVWHDKPVLTGESRT